MVRHPPAVPRWKSLLRAFKFVANPTKILRENSEKYGKTYQFHIGGIQKGLMTTDPEVIQHVLQKNHRNYFKSDIQTKILARFVGQGLLTSNGDYWLRQRRLIQPGFHRERLTSLTRLIVSELDPFLDSLDAGFENRNRLTINISSSMHHLAFQIIAKTLFSTGISEDEVQILSEKINQIQRFVVKQIRQPYLRTWLEMSGKLKSHDHIAAEVRSTILKIIQERKHSNVDSNDLLQMLLNARYEDTLQPMTDQQLLDECLILFIAGHETSGHALAWTFYLLSMHPEIQKDLYAEIGNRDINQIDFEELAGMPFSRAVIDEAMRLYPPAWIIDRVAKSDDQIKDVFIPSGSKVFLDIYGLHHDPDFWPDAERFNPTRFMSIPMQKSSAFLPFGSGPRLCIGQHFAILEMQLVLLKMVQAFEILPGNQEVELKPMITLRSKEDIQINLEKRNHL